MTYRVEIDLDGTTYKYPDGPTKPALKVLFRPREIVFRLGVSTPENYSASVGVDLMNGYVARVYKDEVLVATKTASTPHWWGAKHRYQIVPERIVATPKQLLDNKLVPAYALYGGRTSMPTFEENVYDKPLSLGGLTAYQGQTGERRDIGRLAEWEVFALLTGEFGPALAAAEGWGSFPIHLPNERTGKPWDCLTNLFVTTYGNQNDSNKTRAPDQVLVLQPNREMPEYQGLPVPSYDYAHRPAMLVAVLATRSPYHLETLQNVANNAFIIGRGQPDPSVPVIDQTRGWWWSLRDLLDAETCTKLAEQEGWIADYHLPSSYFTQCIANMAAYMDRYMVNNPAMAVFHFGPSTQYAQVYWQMDFGVMTMASVVERHPEWKPRALWYLDHLIKRTNGKSGWPICNPTGYNAPAGPNITHDQSSPQPGTERLSDYFSSYAAAWQAMVDGCANSPDGNYFNYSLQQVQAISAHPDSGRFNSWAAEACLYAVEGVNAFTRLLRNGTVSGPGTEDLEICHANMARYALDTSTYMNVPLRLSMSVDANYPDTATISAAPQPIPDPPPDPVPIPDPVPDPVPEPDPAPPAPVTPSSILALVNKIEPKVMALVGRK